MRSEPTPDVSGTAVWENIGKTPLLRLDQFAPELSEEVQMYAKAEWVNPGGSVKDRPALHMILQAERSGQLTEDTILLDASSGNTALAYAMIGAAKGYQVKLCVPGNVSQELIRTLRAYGTDLILTDPREGSDGAIGEAQAIYHDNPDSYCYLDQYTNPANWRAHYRTTGVEIWQQTNGQITHFVAGLGTSGTFIGTGRRLKELNEHIKLISVQPESPLHGLEGLKHMATAIVPGIYDEKLADQAIAVSTEDAQIMVKRLAREGGIFAGVSSGAAAFASLQVAKSLESGVVVTIFPDSGRRYIHEKFWENE
ncbi:MAG TPA: cysteine synthase family protein [bacterium]|nr:cysteine synthase family protein [bacterium]